MLHTLRIQSERPSDLCGKLRKTYQRFHLPMERPFYRSWGTGAGASWARRGVPGRPRAPLGLSRIYSVPQAINASRGFARCEGVSHICLGRVKINCISINWRAYSLHRQSDIQEREPSTHTPKVCPVPRPTRLSQANAACGQTQHRAAPCHVLMEQICVKWTWTRLYVVLSTVQPVADTFTRT